MEEENVRRKGISPRPGDGSKGWAVHTYTVLFSVYSAARPMGRERHFFSPVCVSGCLGPARMSSTGETDHMEYGIVVGQGRGSGSDHANASAL